MSSSKERANTLLSKQVLTRMSEEEHEAWANAARDAGMPMNIFVRRVMGHALGISPHVEEIDRQVMAGKINRAAHMRTFRVRAGTEDTGQGVATRRAS